MVNDTQCHSGEKAAEAFKPHHCESQITWKSTLLLDLPSESGGKPCPFHLMSWPLNIKAKLPAAGNNFALKHTISTYTSEFYPQSLRKKTMPTRYPLITTV